MSSKPDYLAYAPIRGTGDKAHWLRIGGAWWKERRGQSSYLSLKIDLIPVDHDWNGQVNLFPNDRENDDGAPF